MTSKCLECKHYRYIPAKTNAPPEDCYPEEEFCEEEWNENLGTEGGCFEYEPAE